MRPLCHQCQTKPADIVEDKILWCAVCKVHDLRVRGEIKVTRPVLTNRTTSVILITGSLFYIFLWATPFLLFS